MDQRYGKSQHNWCFWSYRRMVEFCAERGLCVNNTYFEQKSLHKYIRVARDRDGLEVKSMIDLELVKKDMLRYVQDMRAVRGIR